MKTRPMVVVGLGNPGSEYENTRHNIGFEIIDKLSSSEFKKEKNYLYCRYRDAVLIKPTTYMNLSGQAVQSALARFCSPLSEMLVVYDDFSLPLGKIRFRQSGSSGGHNGLKSIIELLGEEFPRLKIGVGPLPEGIDPADYVLGKFLQKERAMKRCVIFESVKIINEFLTSGYSGSKTWDVTQNK